MSTATQYLPGYQPPAPEPKRITAPCPSWMPPELAALVTGKRVRFRFGKGERQVLRRRRPIPVSEWAEKHRSVRLSTLPGKWKNRFTPYLVGIMDAAKFPGVQTLILCKTLQTGGTESAHNVIGYCIDRDPGPTMYVYPDEITARENAQDRIKPMLEDSPRLKQYLTGYANDTSSLRINLTNMAIWLGWSGSVARLGNKPIRYLILDELDKYKDPKHEATSEALAEGRTTTYANRGCIIFKISTPSIESGAIWRALHKEASCIFDWWVRCPDCNGWQLMSFDRIRWPEDQRDPEVVLAQKLAEYCCEHCGSMWDDYGRDRAVRAGEWRDRASGLELTAYLHTYKPMKIGFHMPSWISYFVSLSKVAWAFLKWNESGDLDDLKRFKNEFCAEPWKEQFEERKEDRLQTLCDSRERGAVPTPELFEAGLKRPPVACLLGTVDTQGRYFKYVIRAHAYGSSEESWLVQAGSVHTFEDLEHLFKGSEYHDALGRAFRVKNVMIDAMGNRTPQVYRWAVKHRGFVFPFQGVQHLSTPIVLSPQEFYPDAKGNKVKIPGGMILYRCDITYFKSDLAHSLEINPDDPGAFHLHSNERGELDEYLKEMCAEVWDQDKNCWANPYERPEHFWDCEMMQKALAYQLNIRNWRLPEEQISRPAPQPPMPGRRSAADKLARLRRRG